MSLGKRKSEQVVRFAQFWKSDRIFERTKVDQLIRTFVGGRVQPRRTATKSKIIRKADTTNIIVILTST